ncbi:SCO family protein [Saccharophagus degradans]|uniref:Electron transport protein SCO1/SenC n=1 Tax=Saccharophagus degradans (strain 2-40 / ATCC 43961 / DSM 17024) TaxID=203122 RepID=Q21PS0_SACD2|nr:SCO family protein [Saccharophagus degradans]ABD79309.1 electron transport protein SCO1/SenC [Saccharophagus degradans 2-40]WGO98509.1 SCO family protein [Saccharophagus degradans]
MTEQTNKQQKGIKYTVIAAVAFMVIVLSLFMNKILQPRILSDQQLRANGAIEFDTARIIRDFNLVDQNNQPYTLEALKGKWTLIYFGFTHCPDICPTTLMQLSKVVNSLEPEIKANTQVLMVTADPARDTPEKLKIYIEHFNKDFNAITGEFLAVKRLAGDLNVAFNKVMLDNGDYTIDHSGNLILINPHGHYHGFFKPPFELAKLKLTYQSIVSSAEL